MKRLWISIIGIVVLMLGLAVACGGSNKEIVIDGADAVFTEGLQRPELAGNSEGITVRGADVVWTAPLVPPTEDLVETEIQILNLQQQLVRVRQSRRELFRYIGALEECPIILSDGTHVYHDIDEDGLGSIVPVQGSLGSCEEWRKGNY